RLLSAPVLLVLNASSLARTAAAIVKGCQAMAEGFAIAGVIANQVGSAGHARLIREAVEGVCNVPVIGYLMRDVALAIPERHLGLVPAVERGELAPLFAKLAASVAETVDLNAVVALARSAPPLAPESARLFSPATRHSGPPRARIAVARDEAFSFYYPENLELLEWHGATLVCFRPVRGDRLPDDVDGLYIGGGFPEVYAAELARNHTLKADIRRAAAAGMPIFAECGGYLYLCRAVTTTDGQTHEMVGLIPARARMQERLAALGYREVRAEHDTPLLAAGETARGHAFHYSVLEPDPDAADAWPYAYCVHSRFGERREGYAAGAVLAGYTHLHFASNPRMAARWVAACAAFRRRRQQPRG
ncbi:MAG TPA: cobyrinate a,c-diamide synthase, partial [Calditerricola sp.]